MDEFCGSKFWDWDLTWNTNDPDLTPCFQKTVLVWIPCGFLWLFGISLRCVRQKEQLHIPWSVFNISKIVICLLLVLLQVVDLANEVLLDLEGVDVYSLDKYTPILELVTYGLALAMVVYAKRKGIRSSDIQFWFWFLKTVLGAVSFRSAFRNYSLISDSGDLVRFLVQVISYPLVVGQFLLHCWSDQVTNDCSKSFYPGKRGDSRPPCPKSSSSPLSRLFFFWFDSLAWKGYRQPLEMNDLWKLDNEFDSTTITKAFEDQWRSRVKAKTTGGKTKQIGLLSVLFSAFGVEFVLGSALTLVPDLLVFVPPQILNLLIGFVNGSEETWKGYFYAALLLLNQLVSTLTLNQYTWKMFQITFKVKSSLTSAVYRKALTVSNAARKDHTVGQVVNLISVDIQKICDLVQYINIAWTAPVQIIIALYFLWSFIGASALAGLAVIVLLIIINAYTLKMIGTYQFALMKLKDERVKLMAEIVPGIKILKLYAWEPSFQGKVLEIREREMKTLKSIAFITGFNEFCWTCSHFMIMLATFTTYVLVSENNVLDAQTTFVSLALLNIMAESMTFMPRVVVYAVQAAVGFSRLNKFMNSEEIDPQAVSHDKNEHDPIVVENGSFTWDRSESNVLNNISLRVKEGSLVAVVGTVGSGKSSLLSAVLGEMELASGRVNVVGGISYAAQIPWIQNETLRENILFGKPYESLKYNAVIDACCLNPDLDVFPGRDKIEIGEKGINLSGGQKQRVSLARAVYNRASIYLFDDPLSAVDAHVGKHIFDKVLGPKGLLRKKTRVLVTHSVTYLPQVDQIIVLKDGRISETGSYQELVDRQGDFSAFLAEYMKSESKEDARGGNEPNLEDNLKQSQFSTMELHKSGEAFSSSELHLEMESLSGSTREGKAGLPEAEKLIADETSEIENVSWRVYFQYFKASGSTLLILSVFGFAVFQGFAASANYWLSVWSAVPPVNGTQPDTGYYIGVYAALGLSQSLFFILATILTLLACLRSSTIFHSQMLSRILQAPMSFFDTTPTGRILNRFSKDVDVLDNMLPFWIRFWLSMFVQLMGAIVMIIINLPIFLAAVVPLGLLFFAVQKFYIPTSTQLKRLDSTTRSPIFSHVSETLNGTQTIRAYGDQARFMKESEGKVDENLACFIPWSVAMRWLTLRLEIIGSLAIFLTAVFAVANRETLDPGAVGLSITYALNIAMVLTLLTRSSCGVETTIVAAERIIEYCEVSQEAPWKSNLRKPPSTWPSMGSVQFENYRTRYREGLDPVLKGVTFDIQPGEKVGVVGRTGAGKSSLTLALFRIVEATNGSITIDGEDVSKIGLHDLRGKLTIIPQDPILFSGPLRFNLDPFDAHEDSAIWRALGLAHLSTFVSGLPLQLQHSISEGGDNLSVGQKQLLCLARALLRKSKILVLDEATAAIDLETDDLIQATIRSEFKDSTVITIAHRINTVLDSSRILLLDDGHIREFDSPSKLLEDSSSLFYQMVKTSTGEETQSTS